MDNNVIEQISGLESLTNLEWLDLSFNNISKIEGLDKLIHLKDLSLYNNQIKKIENLDNLTNLQVLSLGNNPINDLNQIRYLRDFPKLESVNLAGTPMSQDQEYKVTILAFLDHIRYLDYCLVKEQEVVEAKETKQDELQGLQESDRAKKAIEEKKKKDEERMSELREAYLDVTVTLLDEMLGSILSIIFIILYSFLFTSSSLLVLFSSFFSLYFIIISFFKYIYSFLCV